MSFNTVVKAYLRDFIGEVQTAIKTGEFTPELSFRPVLDRFFRKACLNINSEIEIIHEPHKQEKSGRPDWRFHNKISLGIYGYCEAKGFYLERKLNISEHKVQIEKYKKLGHKLLITDGIDFIFVYPNSSLDNEFINLISKPIDLNKIESIEPNPLFESKFRSFFSDVGFRECTEEQLVQEAAKRATCLSESIDELVRTEIGAGFTEEENKTIDVLHDLKNLLSKHHDITLQSPDSFSDFVSQVLVFGLLYSHRVIRQGADDPVDRYAKIHKFWFDVIFKNYSERLRPFKALVSQLDSELNSLGEIGIWYDDLRLMLAHVKQTDAFTATPDYHSLFEKFLTIFDPETRFSYGAFYTPPPLAKFAVNLTEAIISQFFVDQEIYAEGNKIIDPCCGTGNFLEWIISIIPKNNIKCRVSGFEILPGPYALAHYRLTMLSPPSYPNKINIYLTDTLSDSLENIHPSDCKKNDFATELLSVHSCSRPPLTMIIGNPPSSDSMMMRNVKNQKIILKKIDDWRPPKSQRSDRQNIQKQLNNEFVKFLRWSCDKLGNNTPGILTFVLPSSFAEEPSYKYIRIWFAEFFDSIWVLDIDKDGRTGVRADSIFNTLQGRLLFVGIRDGCSNTEKLKEIKYGSINDYRKIEKLEFLSKSRSKTEFLSFFKLIEISQPNFVFRSIKQYDKYRYNKFWPLVSSDTNGQKTQGIFLRHCSGVKLAPTSLFTHIHQKILIRKMKSIADVSVSFDQIKQKWFIGQQKPPNSKKITNKLRQKLSDSLENYKKYIRQYSYRPFVTTNVYFDTDILSYLKDHAGGGTRYRPEILAAFNDKKTIGFSLTPAPKHVGGNLHRFVSFCWNLPDNDLSKRGNGRILCNRFPEYKQRKKDWDSKAKINVNNFLKEKFETICYRKKIWAENAIVFYVYGILCSNYFLDTFEGALYTSSSEDWPRVPVVKDEIVFEKIASYGKSLADLENPMITVLDPIERSELKKRFNSPFLLEKFQIDKTKKQIRLHDHQTTRQIYNNVSDQVLNFQISGYFPIYEWLKLHTKAYSRMEFSLNYHLELIELMRKIEMQIKIVEDLDELVYSVLDEDESLLLPN